MQENVLKSRIGFEIELLAPRGKSRFDLADAIAKFYSGRTKRVFHPQAEPINIPNNPIFENLTLGFEIHSSSDELIALCLDDLTLQADLNKSISPKDNWYRIVSDDSRLLQLVACQVDAELPITNALTKIADLYHTTVESDSHGMKRVVDLAGQTIAIAAPLPGERERACELVTAPIQNNHQNQLDSLLNIAKSLCFTIPSEGATHLHFEAFEFYSAHVIRNIINLFGAYDKILMALFQTNNKCIRLGEWHHSIYDLVEKPFFPSLTWQKVKDEFKRLPLTKYCNYNLVNIIHEIPEKPTFEVRILPSTLDPFEITCAASVIETLLGMARSSTAYSQMKSITPSKENIQEFLNTNIPNESVRQYYTERQLQASSREDK